MADEDEQPSNLFAQQDHQVAYLFHPDDVDARPSRPAKRRRVSKQSSKSNLVQAKSDFIPLLNGAEKPAAVELRQSLFEGGWEFTHARIQEILRESNSATLGQVKEFVSEAKAEITDKIPSAFIITGTDIAAQDLLFEQLSESLQESLSSKFVRLRSHDGTTLKATLKKIIRDASSKSQGHEGDDDEEGDVQIESAQNGRKYLDYDLEALYAIVRQSDCEHVFVAFQDSEGFDSGLLSDLIMLFNSWRPRIPFTLLFGIATSVDLLQARLLKSVCQLIYGAQFDVVQTDTILETVFRGCVAACDAPLMLGSSLLRNLLHRQREQVAGIQAFTSSLKYAYMSHFYANPLSALSDGDRLGEIVQQEHLEALRNSTSFRRHIDDLIATEDSASLDIAQRLIDDDAYLEQSISNDDLRLTWRAKLLRSIVILEACGALKQNFSDTYISALASGLSADENTELGPAIQRLEAADLSGILMNVAAIFDNGDESLSLGSELDAEATALRESLEAQRLLLDELRAVADEQEIQLRSSYSGHGKVTRTTVIAQRVQLSRDSAVLSDEDKKFTDVVDEVVRLLSAYIQVTSASSILLSEAWLYESRSPLRDVMVPCPRIVFERSLARPHDYLGCACCAPGEENAGGLRTTLPATSILYQMYLETGNLINVADLWAAFHALVGSEEEDEEGDRQALAAFYRGLAELRALGFVKPSKKKVDHIAKLKWL